MRAVLQGIIIAIGLLGFLIVFGSVGLSDYETEAFLAQKIATITPFSVIVLRTLSGLVLLGGSILAYKKIFFNK